MIWLRFMKTTKHFSERRSSGKTIRTHAISVTAGWAPPLEHRFIFSLEHRSKKFRGAIMIEWWRMLKMKLPIYHYLSTSDYTSSFRENNNKKICVHFSSQEISLSGICYLIDIQIKLNSILYYV